MSLCLRFSVFFCMCVGACVHVCVSESACLESSLPSAFLLSSIYQTLVLRRLPFSV
jgi:hypothetical protein